MPTAQAFKEAVATESHGKTNSFAKEEGLDLRMFERDPNKERKVKERLREDQRRQVHVGNNLLAMQHDLW